MVKQELKNLNSIYYHLTLHMTLKTPLNHYKTYFYLLLFQAYHFFVLIFLFQFCNYYFDNLYFGNVLPFFFYLQIVYLFSKKKIKLKKYYILYTLFIILLFPLFCISDNMLYTFLIFCIFEESLIIFFIFYLKIKLYLMIYL